MQRFTSFAAAALLLSASPAAAASLISADGLRATPNSVRVRAVTADKAGYIVVRVRDQGGAPGEVLGLKPVEVGQNGGLSIPLGRKMKPGATLIVMLHEDTNGDSEFDDADAPVKSANAPIQQLVTVE